MDLAYGKKKALLKWMGLNEDCIDDIVADNAQEYELDNCFFIDKKNGDSYAIVAQNEMRGFAIDYVLGNHNYLGYSFENIATSINVNLSEVENYFLHHILSNDSVVEKSNNKYYVEGDVLNELIEKHMTKKQFVANYVDCMIKKGILDDLIFLDKASIDNFNIYFLG